MRAHAHLKPMTQAKPFSKLEIFWMHDKNAFRGLGVISLSRVELSEQIKI